jgi:ribosomal protein S18 acetylase RimI-like enzyme
MVAAPGPAELATAAAPVQPAELATAPVQRADALTIRPASPADIAELRAFFTGLSVLTRHRRFFAAITPTTAMLLALAGGSGNVDAIVAVRRGMIVGHAMAADQVHEPDRVGGNGVCNGQDDLATDIGIVVADTWQGRGVGSALMRALVARASARGVASLTMNVLHDNRRVLAMITSHWPAATARLTDDSIALRVQL